MSRIDQDKGGSNVSIQVNNNNDDDNITTKSSSSSFTLFRNPNRLRKSVDVRIGQHRPLKTNNATSSSPLVVEVLFQLRQRDYGWYIRNTTNIHVDLLELLESAVLPRMFRTEIISYHRAKYPSIFPPNDLEEDDNNDDDISKIGSKNKAKKRKQAAINKNAKKNKKTKQSTATKTNSKTTTTTTSTNSVADDDQDNGEASGNNYDRVYRSFGSLLQLAYRKEPIGSMLGNYSSSGISSGSTSSGTKVFRTSGNGTLYSLASSSLPHRSILATCQQRQHDDDDDGVVSKNATGSKLKKTTTSSSDNETSLSTVTFHHLEKLPSRLLVWISPLVSSEEEKNNKEDNKADEDDHDHDDNQQQQQQQNDEYEFFHRPEMIPVTDLFRTPKEFLDDDEDDEDE